MACQSYGLKGGNTMTMSEMIKQGLEKKGITNFKQSAKVLGVSSEILRVTINKGHIPKDSTLNIIADKLDLDRSALILKAHQEKVPNEMKKYFLAPTLAKLSQGKRVFPLSEEQCDYLKKMLNIEEIQLIRKMRQLSPEAKIQFLGYVNYMYETKKAG